MIPWTHCHGFFIGLFVFFLFIFPHLMFGGCENESERKVKFLVLWFVMSWFPWNRIFKKLGIENSFHFIFHLLSLNLLIKNKNKNKNKNKTFILVIIEICSYQDLISLVHIILWFKSFVCLKKCKQSGGFWSMMWNEIKVQNFSTVKSLPFCLIIYFCLQPKQTMGFFGWACVCFRGSFTTAFLGNFSS